MRRYPSPNMATKNRWKTLKEESDLDGVGKFTIIDPHSLYRGKSYSEWTCDWFNWFVSADADNRTSGPVVFLRSRGLPNKLTGANISDVPAIGGASGDMQESFSEDPKSSASYARSYVNDPNVRIGGDRLKIFEDQAVFVPIIIAYWLKYEPNTDYGSMHDFTGLTIDYGDNPPDPEQLTINMRPALSEDDLIRDEDVTSQNQPDPEKFRMNDFRITSPIFTAIIPDVQYGRSIKDFLEGPIVPGSYPAIVEGYFVMLKFTEGSYWVHSWASAPREVRGPYFSELLYQIEVSPREQRLPGRTTPWRPSRNERILNKIYEQKQQNGDLTQKESNRFRSYFLSTEEDKKTGREKRVRRKHILHLS
jgi:hypothetical protein